jgi:hypothetical protein
MILIVGTDLGMNLLVIDCNLLIINFLEIGTKLDI